MVSINKQGNALVIEFTDNDKYLFDGIIEVAPNELMVVIDKSNMATFKKASNGDVLFSQLISDIQIAGSPVTKDTIIDQFAAIGFISGGGGSGEGAVNSVNGQTGDVIITPASLNVYTRAEVDDAINEETTERQKQDSALGGMIAAETAAREQAVASKQDILVSGQNIKTINGQSVLGSGNIAIQGGTSNWDDIQGKPEFAEVATSGSYNDLTDKPEIPDVSNLATKSEVAAKQDTLVSGENIKTVNGQSLLGNGNIDITSGGTITVDSSLSTTSENPVQNKVITNAINGKQDAGDYALKSEIPDVSGLATKAELAGKQDTLTQGAGIKIADNTIRTINNVQQVKIIPQSSGFIFNTISVDNAGNPSIVNAQLSNTKDQDIQFEPDSSNPSTPMIYIKLSDNVVRKTVADATYATKQELAGKLDTATYNSEKASFETKENAAATYQVKGDYATTAQLNSKQDTLVSGTNIKTINGNSILGEGDITVSGGSASKEWHFLGAADFLTGTTTNAEINVVGGTISYDDVSIGDNVTLDNDYDFVVLNKYTDDHGNHIAIMPIYNAVTNNSNVLGYVIDLNNSASATVQINKATVLSPVTFTATASKNIEVDTSKAGAISLTGFTGYNTGKPGDIVKITYSSKTWNLVITGKYTSNGRYLILSGLGTKYTGYRIGSGNLMYSYVPFDPKEDASIAIGGDTYNNGGTKYEVAIGTNATTNGANSVAIGGGASAGTSGVAIGGQATTTVENSIVLGYNVQNTDKKVVIGNGETHYIEVDDKVNIRKSDGTMMAIEDSVMTSEEKSKLANTPTFWTGTQTEYDAIQTKDENTYYFIKEG